MSLFDDDVFGSASRSEDGSRRGQSWLGILILSIGIGLLLTVLVFPYLVSKGYVAVDTSIGKHERVIAVAEKVQPAVVSILGYNGQPERNLAEMMEYSQGSGVIIGKQNGKAQIVTNHHVISDVSTIEVMLANGDKLPATVVGKDEISDLAVLEVDDKKITHIARFGNSDRLRVGETAIAIGNPLALGNTPTITTGVISSLKRTVPVSLADNGMYDWELDVIQTDAAINEGNSGGALLNLNGEVIGIISMKVLETGVEGLAFALPINQAKPVIEQLLTDKKVRRPFIGIVMQDLQQFVGTESLKLPADVQGGVVVLDVEGPAKDAGLQAEDVIVGLDDQPITDTIELRKYLYAEKKIGDRLKIKYYRNGKLQSSKLTLQELKLD